MLHKDKKSFKISKSAMAGWEIVTVEVLEDKAMQTGPFVVWHVDDCWSCGKPSAPCLMPLDLWKQWLMERKLIQNLFPWMTQDEREHLMSGWHVECQQRMSEPESL